MPYIRSPLHPCQACKLTRVSPLSMPCSGAQNPDIGKRRSRNNCCCRCLLLHPRCECMHIDPQMRVGCRPCRHINKECCRERIKTAPACFGGADVHEKAYAFLTLQDVTCYDPRHPGEGMGYFTIIQNKKPPTAGPKKITQWHLGVAAFLVQRRQSIPHWRGLIPPDQNVP